MNRIWRKLRWSLKQRGLAGTIRTVFQRGMAGEGAPMQMHPFDVRYGTDTGGLIGGGLLGAGHSHDLYITAYAGMPPSRFEATVDRWLVEAPSAPFESYSFVDVGCGKGRVVLLASRRPFARVIGVELDPGLAQIGQANLALWRAAGQPAAPVEIVCADATEFRLPDGPCLLYLANPFAAPVLRRLLERLEERAQAGGAEVDLLYQNAEQRAVFEEFPKWRLLWEEALAISEEDAAAEPVYRTEDRCLAFRRQDA